MMNLDQAFENKTGSTVVREIRESKDFAAAIKVITTRKYRKILDSQTLVNRLIQLILRSGDSAAIFDLITSKYIQSATEADLKYILQISISRTSSLSWLVIERTLDYLGEKYDLGDKLIRLKLSDNQHGFIRGFMFCKEKRCI